MLKYIGDGFIMGIPARDIGSEELADLERTIWKAFQANDPTLKTKRLKSHLLDSGLYVEEKAAAGPSQDKALKPGAENK